MDKKYFPVFIDISEKKIVVIGGGTIATRRIKTLTEFAKDITVVAPEVSEVLMELYNCGIIKWHQADYKADFLQGAELVIAATNQPDINHQVKKDCRYLEAQTGKSILVSVADDRTACDFYFPSIIQKEEIVVAVNSGGTSPKQTKYIREKIEKLLDSESIY